ncbi:MAG TPA: phage holin family protein [Verrucomicrobiae bacterium]|nr:phage holin family protein [Verrucomicrobiae bacterium]
MTPKLKEFLQRWLINTVAVLVASCILPGIHYRTWPDLLVTTFVLGILNTFVRPLLMLLSLPLVIFTIGLFRLVINALLLMFVSFLMQSKFHVESFGWAFAGAVVIGLVSVALHILTGTNTARIEFRRGKPPAKSDRDGGPFIDV